MESVAATISTIIESGIMVVICGVVIYLLAKYFSAMIETKGKKAHVEKVAETNAVEFGSIAALKELHSFFPKMEGILELKIPTLSIGGPVRTDIFKDILRIFYETAIRVIKDTLDKNLTDKTFLSENKEMINRLLETSKVKMMEAEIPTVAIYKFLDWSSKRYDYVMSTLSDIDSCDAFASTVEKQYAALNLYQSTFYFFLIDAEKTLKYLNGDLTGAIYKGREVESLHD